MAAKANIEDIYPLTPMQEGMLFYSLNRDTAGAYFEQVSYRLHGELDIEPVKKSLKALMQRHDILRTVFIHEKVKRPVQVVMKERKIDFTYEDVGSVKTKAEREARVKEIKEQDRQRPFVLSKDVLIRVTVVKLARDEYEFTWSHPHIIMDGWCMGIIIGEYLEIYRSFLENRPPDLAPVKPFKSYIQWLGKRDIRESLAYWTSYLEDYNAPAFIPRLETRTSGGGGFDRQRVTILLTTEQTSALNNLVGKNSVTINTLVQTAWGLVLGKYKGERDVIFGAVVSGRPAEIKGVERMIGLFLNTVPMRIRVRERENFIELMRRVQQEILASEPYHYCSLASIQAVSPMKRDLFDHIFVSQNFPISEKIAGAAAQGRSQLFQVSGVETFEYTSYDFVVHVSYDRQLSLRLDYNGRVYEKEIIEGIARSREQMLTQDLGKIEIKELCRLDGEKKRRMLEEFNEDLEDE